MNYGPNDRTYEPEDDDSIPDFTDGVKMTNPTTIIIDDDPDETEGDSDDE